uniref:acid phosphatase n=1 Tax=Phallusia mammillata TaxID=59560 RepID=A0A6F9D4Z1_9ASCI|nr:prostatic acid phosphatase-like [Phallusia mammillata]
MYCYDLSQVIFSVLCAIGYFSIPVTSKENDLQLIFANVVWRHGARSSLRSFPTDPYNHQNIWPNGPGQLSQVGMKQHYELGRYFRKKYGGILLNEFYQHNQIYVRSTDVDRTLMSAQCNMAGLYPPQGYELWNQSYTNWQPFPVHTVPSENDQLLHMNPSMYPEYNKIMQKIFKSPQYENLNKMHANFLKNLSEWSGMFPMNIGKSWSVQDPLACERAENLTLPKWATPAMMHELSSLAGLDMSIISGGIDYEYREKFAPFCAGPLVKKILENLDDKIFNRTTFNFIAYSAHDTTLSALLVALKTFNIKSPPFASSVIFELYRNKSSSNGLDEYYVQAFYKNTSDTAHPISLLGCDLLCPLSELKQLAQSIIVPLESPTQGPTEKTELLDFAKQHYLGVVLSVVISVLVVTWLVVLVYVCRSKQKVDKYKYKENVHYQPLTAYDEIPNTDF